MTVRDVRKDRSRRLDLGSSQPHDWDLTIGLERVLGVTRRGRDDPRPRALALKTVQGRRLDGDLSAADPMTRDVSKY